MTRPGLGLYLGGAVQLWMHSPTRMPNPQKKRPVRKSKKQRKARKRTR